MTNISFDKLIIRKIFRKLRSAKNKSISIPNQVGEIYFRIIISDQDPVEITTKIKCIRSNWDSSKGRLKGRDESSRTLNQNLIDLENRLRNIYSNLLLKADSVSNKLIKDALTGTLHQKNDLLGGFKKWIEQHKDTHAKTTHKHYNTTHKYLEEFIRSEYRRSDFPVKLVDYEFEQESDFLSGVVDEDVDEESLSGTEVLEGTDDEYQDDEDEFLDNEDEEEIMNSEIHVRKRKRLVERKIKKLFNAILSHSTGYEWTNSQLNRMLRGLEEVQRDIENFLEYESNLYKENAYWRYLDYFIDLFHSFSNAGGDVEIDFEPEISDYISTVLKVTEFDETYNWIAVFDIKWNRLMTELESIDGVKIDIDVAYDYQAKISTLIEDLKKADANSEHKEKLILLKSLRKDFKRIGVKIENSFWDTARFDLDKELHELES